MMKKIFINLLSVVMIFVCCSRSTAANQDIVLILTNKGVKQYEIAVESFKQQLSNKAEQVSYMVIDENDAEKSAEALLNALASPPKLVLTVGTEKSLLAKKNIKDIPILFTMVLDPVESGIVDSLSSSGSNITGVSLKISIKSQFEKFKQALPDIEKIGMIYDATTKEAMKKEADIAARELGLELVAKAINSKSDVTNALDELITEADCLWAGVDTMVYNAQSSKYILLNTLRNKIPFMAFSSNYVNAGALMALESDYDEIGRQTADIAMKILNGQNPGSIQIDGPRKVKMLINQNTADVIGITIPQELLD